MSDTYAFTHRPLPKNPGDWPKPAGHAGLWMEKWGPLRDARDGADWPGQETKSAWVKALAGGRGWGDAARMQAAEQRLRSLAEARCGLLLTLEAEEPLIVGIGLPNPLENGLVWHHRFGAPYVPGSSLKGMCRAWAAHWLELGDDSGEVTDIFGPARPKGEVGADAAPGFAGGVCFLDAIPTAPVVLQAEVMTPHYGPYYGEALEKDPVLWPGDWFSPVPIGYLAIAPGARFVTALLPRIKGRHQGLLADAADWLKNAAAFIGVGAKTSRGMGRMRVEEA